MRRLRGRGAGTGAHAVPFHRTTMGFAAELLPVEPTAHALLAEVAATPPREPLTGERCRRPHRPWPGGSRHGHDTGHHPRDKQRHGENSYETCGELGRAHRAATSPLAGPQAQPVR
jgi:hypothetical protein